MDTMLMIRNEEEEETDKSESNLSHWTWIEDPNETLCGLDATSMRWISDDVAIECQKCIEIDMLSEMWGTD